MAARLGKFPRRVSIEEALCAIGESPQFVKKSEGHFQHASTRYKAVVNWWTTGTCNTQGGQQDALAHALLEALRSPAELPAPHAGPALS